MNTKRQVLSEIDGLVGLKSLVEVYQEVAASRMQRIRGAVLQSRMFMDGLVGVFKKVRHAYKALPNKPKEARRMNGRTVAVFVSANAGLYGDIVDRTFTIFEDFVHVSTPDVVVLGKVGMKMMQDRLPKVLFNYFDFLDEGIDMEGFDMVMRYLIQFERIQVFHGQFKTLLSQSPIQTHVSGESIQIDDTDGSISKAKYLFEPSVEDIARVFEGEILGSLFEQTLHESQLAKFASRMLALDRSIDSIEHRLKKVEVEKVRIMHKIRNRKQLSTISGVSLWT